MVKNKQTKKKFCKDGIYKHIVCKEPEIFRFDQTFKWTGMIALENDGSENINYRCYSNYF